MDVFHNPAAYTRLSGIIIAKLTLPYTTALLMIQRRSDLNLYNLLNTVIPARFWLESSGSQESHSIPASAGMTGCAGTTARYSGQHQAL